MSVQKMAEKHLLDEFETVDDLVVVDNLIKALKKRRQTLDKRRTQKIWFQVDLISWNRENCDDGVEIDEFGVLPHVLQIFLDGKLPGFSQLDLVEDDWSWEEDDILARFKCQGEATGTIKYTPIKEDAQEGIMYSPTMHMFLVFFHEEGQLKVFSSPRDMLTLPSVDDIRKHTNWEAESVDPREPARMCIEYKSNWKFV